MKKINTEVLIVGSGAGGSTVGAYLVEAGFDVTMIEEGPSLENNNIPSKLSDSFARIWRNGGVSLAHSKNNLISFAEGCVSGGSTEINSAIYQYAPTELLNLWEKKYKNKVFNFKSIYEGYNAIESRLDVNYEYDNLGQHSDILMEIAKTNKWSYQPLMRLQKYCVGTNNCSIFCPTGAKKSMSTSLLKDFKINGGNLISNCKAIKLNIKSNKISSLSAILSNNLSDVEKVEFTFKYIFVCGGATQTPFLLIRSGLKGLIGNDFKLHPTLKVVAEFDKEIDASNTRLPHYAIDEFMPNFRIGGSVFSLPTLGMFISEDRKNREHFYKKYKNLVMYYVMCRGTGKGSISKQFFSQHPFIKYEPSTNDLKFLNKGLEKLSTALFNYGALSVQPSILGQETWKNKSHLKKFLINANLKNYTLMSIHLFGSMKMGDNHKLCSVNSRGLVNGFTNLYVADASLIPESLGTNPQATVMSISYQIAKKFIDERK
jgi:choline dehydrogenase-like flavoprotein